MFGRGHHRDAFAILGAYIDELADVGNLDGEAIVGIEFVRMMVALDRVHDAAALLGHFDSTGLLAVEGLGFKIFLADAIEVVEARVDPAAATGRTADEAMGDREAPSLTQQVLNDLLG
ncbi:MAG: hypothetical protein GY925_02905 [Actinomycetia bacterium]|nr:hypothetical protein [Actinomycetes bacterium]